MKSLTWLLLFAVLGCDSKGSGPHKSSAVPTIPGTGTGTGVSGGHGPAVVVLRQSGDFVILAKAAITNVPTSAITGHIGISPAAASFITGFALTLPAGGGFASSAQVTGNIYAPTYAPPTPTYLTTAIGDMETAYTDAAGRVKPDVVSMEAGNIGGLTIQPGLYQWSTSVIIPKDVTLTGNESDTWIFQISGDLTQSAGTKVILSGGALAKNVVWQVAGAVAIGTTAHLEGTVLGKTAITVQTGASVTGRLFAQTAVTLAGNVVKP